MLRPFVIRPFVIRPFVQTPEQLREHSQRTSPLKGREGSLS